MIRDKYMTVVELSELLNVKTSTIRHLVFRGELKPVRVGRLLRFRLREIEAWLKIKTEGQI